MSRNIYVLSIGTFINNVGTFTSYMAFIAAAQWRGNFVYSTASIMISIALGSFTGWFILNKYLYRLSKKTMLVVSLACAGSLLLSIVVTKSWYLMLVLLFFLGICDNIAKSSLYTSVKIYIENAEIGRANGMLETASFIGMLVGGICGGNLIDHFSPSVLLVIDSISYAITSVLFIILLRQKSVVNDAEESSSQATAELLNIRDVCFVILIAMISSFLGGGYNVLEMPYFIEILKISYTQIGYLFSVSLIGMLIFFLVSRMSKFRYYAKQMAPIYLLLYGCNIIVWGLQRNVYTTMGLIIIFALLGSCVNTSVRNHIHDTNKNNHILVKAFSTLYVAKNIASIVGMLSVPFIVNSFGVHRSFIVLGLLSIVLLILSLTSTNFFKQKVGAHA